MSSATERAIKAMTAGKSVSAAAHAEGLAPSTLYRALKRLNLGAVQRIVIVGAGAFGREIAQWARRDGRDEIVFLDDHAQGAHVIGTVESYERHPGDEVLLAVADPKARRSIAERIQAATFIASTAICGECQVGVGSLLMPNSLVSAGSVLGECVIVNTNSSVGHDVVLGDFCTLSSHVDLTGRVKVGTGVFFGSGARVIPGVTIGDGAVIGAGAVVVKDVPAGATVFGNPARVVT
jgi:sugar O-acyltransferase (sialic acid O-acetyltransferase NeuD family)